MPSTESAKKPNILMIMVDQFRFPQFGYGPDYGFVDPLKKILGFQGDAHEMNEFRKFFPGLWALRQNAVVLNKHRIASSACVPSRTALFTGQYGTKTGVLYTDGVFKDGSDEDYCWLKRKSFPTIGNWLRTSGYSTHYFGKWHITGENTTDLEDYGFSDWGLSYPDPHGTLPNNLGHYRDYQFEDLVCSFFRRQGLGIPYSIAHAKENTALSDQGFNAVSLQPMPARSETTPDGTDPFEEADKPWFAVASFTNPHDIASYPGLPGYVCDERVAGASYTLAVPAQNTYASLPFGGTMRIKLNQSGFPQNNANVPQSWDENLLRNNKPSCQFEYKYKMGLALVAKSGRLAAEQQFSDTPDANPQDILDYAVDYTLKTSATGLPLAMTQSPELASRSFMQYYGYLLSEVDQHIYKALQALEESGQAENTIVLFCPDHGEYGSAHGTLMEKWHSAYEEVIHVPAIVRFPETVRHVPGGLQQLDEVTSHIDLLPTILGLAGLDTEQWNEAKQRLRTEEHFRKIKTPVGMDISAALLKAGDKDFADSALALKNREGVLFMTHDTITEPLHTLGEEGATEDLTEAALEQGLTNLAVYNAAIERLIHNDNLPEELSSEVADEVTKLTRGSVMQPNHVHAFISKDNWKLVRYFDPEGIKHDQHELYDLNKDPTEQKNLLKSRRKKLKASKMGRTEYGKETIQSKAEFMQCQLVALENQML